MIFAHARANFCLTTAQATALGALLERELPGLAVPPPRADLVEEIRDEPPVPMLLLANRKRSWTYWDARSRDWDQRVDVALLGYAYGGVMIDVDTAPQELRKFEDGRIVVRRRNRAAERKAQKRLEAFGLRDFDDFDAIADDADRIAYSFVDGHQHWELWDGRRAADGTWSWVALTADSSVDNIRPDIHDNFPKHPCGGDLLHNPSKVIAGAALICASRFEGDVLAANADKVIGSGILRVDRDQFRAPDLECQ